MLHVHNFIRHTPIQHLKRNGIRLVPYLVFIRGYPYNPADNRVILTEYCHGAPWRNVAVCAVCSTERGNPLREKLRTTDIRSAVIRAGRYPLCDLIKARSPVRHDP